MFRQPPLRHPDIRASQPHQSRLITLLHHPRARAHSRRRRTEFILLKMLEHTTSHMGRCVCTESPGCGGVSLDEHQVGDVLDHGAAPEELCGPV